MIRSKEPQYKKLLQAITVSLFYRDFALKEISKHPMSAYVIRVTY